jgi:indolepyruvate ferredoxin oxidoreductase alpha subunit
MDKKLLLGDEAIAQGALDAGLSGCYAYPGTPSTGIMEYVQKNPRAKERNVHRTWSVNEKTAMEAALGMSYAGKRAMVCMKHVGLNVAADAFINSALTGVNGGLVVVVADDPSMHSSQNEQDSRFYGKFAMIPVFEPSNQQEAYDIMHKAFDLSEKFLVPVLIRITTRLSHSRSGILTCKQKEENKLKMPGDPRQFILLPSIARNKYKGLISNQEHFESEAEKSDFNIYYKGTNRKLGIIACGIAYNYLRETFADIRMEHSVLKISQYPLPVNRIRSFADECEEILVLEEGYPFVEEMLTGILESKYKIHGRLNGSLPRDGELNADLVGKALGFPTPETWKVPSIVANRPPALCPGCGHTDIFIALNEALDEYGKGRVFSDIGCYTLGALDPLNAIDSCVDMGASVTMAVGAADAGLVPAVAFIGDSTFTHSGMTGLLDAVVKNSPIILIISDNSTTAMTGGQQSAATGSIDKICLGLGVDPDHLHVVIPLKKHHAENVRILKNELDYKGLSVIIARRECVQTFARRKRLEAASKVNK